MAKPWYAVSPNETRGHTNGILELIDEGVLNPQSVLEDLLAWMGGYEVEQFCRQCLSFRDEDNESIIREEDDEDDDPDYLDSDAHLGQVE